MLESRFEAFEEEKNDTEKNLSERINILEAELDNLNKENGELVIIKNQLVLQNEKSKRVIQEQIAELDNTKVHFNDVNETVRKYESSIDGLRQQLDEKVTSRFYFNFFL
jgi:hypothetical protein